MSFAKTGFLSALAFLAAAGAAHAQQVITVPGIQIIINPAPGSAPGAFLMMRQMDQQMAEMDAMMRQADAQMAAMNQAVLTAQPAALGQNAAGVFVTTISDGVHSCTRRIVYPAAGAAQQIQVSETGDSCAALHFGAPGEPAPTALPTSPAAPVQAPPTIQVRAATKPGLVKLADNN